MNKFLIGDDIKNYNNDITSFREKLYKKQLLSKYYEDKDLLLVYNKFDINNNNELVNECRSILVDMKTKSIVYHTGNSPYYNMVGYDFLLQNNNSNMTIYECYEGTMLSVVYHDKWYVSTRRCLDSNNSKHDNTNYYNMFSETLNGKEEDFFKTLNKDYVYHFVLVHHMNKTIIDYSNKFGNNYKKLILTNIRKKNTLEEVDVKTFNISNNIILPTLFNDIKEFDNINNNCDFSKNPNIEGIIILLKKNNKDYIIKLQSSLYQFYKVSGNKSNLYKGYIDLYQKDVLKDFFNKNTMYSSNIVINNKTFDVLGCLYCLFKLLSNELYTLYNMLVDNNGSSKNPELYKLLPPIYREFIYELRGTFFRNKKLTFNNVYRLLKKTNSYKIISMIGQHTVLRTNLLKNNININLNINNVEISIANHYISLLVI